MDSNNSVYVRMMVDVLKRKEKILQRILKQTKEQEVILKQEDVDYERFQSILDAEIDFCGIGFGTADSGAGSTEQ